MVVKQGLQEVSRAERTLRPPLHNKNILLSSLLHHHHPIDPSPLAFIKPSGPHNSPSRTHERHDCRRGAPGSATAAPSQGAALSKNFADHLSPGSVLVHLGK